MVGDEMKTVTYKTVEGGEHTLQIPETPEEEIEVQRKMATGEVDDSHGFSAAHIKRGDKPPSS